MKTFLASCLFLFCSITVAQDDGRNPNWFNDFRRNETSWPGYPERRKPSCVCPPPTYRHLQPIPIYNIQREYFWTQYGWGWHDKYTVIGWIR